MRPQIAYQWHQPESANRAIYAFNNDKNEPDGNASEQYHGITLDRVASALPNRWFYL